MTLPGKIGAELGTFSNGASGVKGYVNVPLWGEVGVFANKSSFTIGNVSEYQLVIPSGKRALEASAKADSRVQSRSALGDDLGASESYLFDVPAAKSQAALGARSLGARDVPVGGQPAEADRIVFVLAYPEGDPALAVESPSGRIYAEGDADVLVERTEWGLMMAVMHPEAGTWQTRVTNIPEGLGYDLSVYGKIPAPELELYDPSFAGDLARATYTARGHSNAAAGSSVELRLGERKDSYFGALAATALVGPDGDFQATLDLSFFADGEYFLFATVEDTLATQKAYAPGSIALANNLPLAAPTALVARESGDRTVAISFDDPNGNRSKGRYVYVASGGAEERIDIGPITAMELPGFARGRDYAIQASAYDASGEESPRSAAAIFSFGSVKPRYNEFSLASAAARLSLVSGNAARLEVAYTVAGAAARGDAFDRMFVSIAQGPSWLALAPKPEGYDLTKEALSANVSLLSMAAPQAGSYVAVLAFQSMGNPEIRDELELALEVRYPSPTISAIAPRVVNRDEANFIDVCGEGFIDGTRVEMDGAPLTLLSLAPKALRFEQPRDLAAGRHEIRVIGPGGAEARSGIEVLVPYYTIVLARSEVSAMAGSDVSFPFSIVGANGFTGSATLSNILLPAGWSAQASAAVKSGESGSIRISIPGQAESGPYAVAFLSDQGDRVDLAVQVTAAPPSPTIQSLSANAVIAGDLLRVYGYGFGSSGSLELGGIEVAIESWSDTEILARIGEGLVSGGLVAKREGLSSAVVTLFILNAGFTIHMPATEISLQPGETRKLSVSVSGVKRPVELAVSVQGEGISSTASTGLLVPNAFFELSASAAADIANGTYKIVIDASSGTVKRQASLIVRIGEAFAIATEDLPDAMEGCAYRSELKAENAESSVSWSLAKGELPGGLWLRSNGIIEGRPTGLGSYTFTLRATDERGRSSEKALSLLVEENAWSQAGKDSGGSGYGGSIAPATERLVWSSEATLGATRLITGGRRVYAYGAEGLKSFDIKTGRTLYALKGAVAQAVYAGGALYLRGEDSVLRAYGSNYGNDYWSLAGVAGFLVEGMRLLVSDENATTEYAPAGALLGPVVARYQGGFSQADTVATFRTVLLRAKGLHLEGLGPEGWITVYEGAAEITTFACDESSIAVADGEGKVTLLGADYATMAQGSVGFIARSLNLSPREIVVQGDGQTAILGREGAGEGARSLVLRTSFGSSGRLALAAEKLAIAGVEGLSIHNVYSGGIIWASPGEKVDAICAVECVFALGSDGVARCYGGPENAVPPSTKIIVSPPEPDGQNGWYASLPVVSLEASDRETYVNSSKLKVGTGDWKTYAGAETLPEGDYPVYAYSIDSRGYREADQYRNLSVDIGTPRVSLSFSPAAAPSGWFTKALSVAIEASDAHSGVMLIEYRLDGAQAWQSYTGNLSFPSEDVHVLEYRATDVAGNVSPSSFATLRIDLADPEPTARSLERPGLALVYMEALDSESGVDRIEYRIDGGDTLVYGGPVSITREGMRAVEYRAVDKADRISSWKSLAVLVPVYKVRGLIQDLRFPGHGAKRSIVEDAKAGMEMYAKERSSHNLIDSLPSYAIGAEYIRMETDDARLDGPYLCSFKAGADLIVYLFKHKASKADMSLWTLKESSFPVEEHKYFIGGAEVYSRRFAKGEKVTIPTVKGKKVSPHLVFVQAPRSDTPAIVSPTADATIHPFDRVQLAATTLAPPEANSSFAWKAWLDGVELAIRGDYLDMPYVRSAARFVVRVELLGSDGKRRGYDERAYDVRNKARIERRSPAPGWPITAGSQVKLSFAAYDMIGASVNPASVLWQAGREPGQLAALSLSADGSFTAPSTAGAFYLKASWTEYPGLIREEIFPNLIVSGTQGITIRFGEDGDGPSCSGEAYGEAEEGLYYGFDEKLDEAVGSFTALRNQSGRGWRFERSGFIEVPTGRSFALLTGPGRFEAKLLVGPYDEKQHYDLNIAGKSLSVDHRDRGNSVYEIRCEVTIGEDGILRLDGGEGLRLIELYAIRLAPEAPLIVDSVKEDKGLGLIVIEHRRDWPEEWDDGDWDWYDWDED